MFIIRRRLKESILIDNGRIVIQVAEIGPDLVKLAIEAPRSTNVRRTEEVLCPAVPETPPAAPIPATR